VSYGKGLQTPTTDELAYRSTSGTQTGLNFDLKASRSDNYETGVKANAGDGIMLTAAGYHIATQNEIVVEANAGGRSVYQNVAQTTRNGVELSAQGRWSNGLGVMFAYTLLNATVDQPFLTCPGSPCTAPVTVAAGNHIPGVPRQVFYSEVSWRHAPLGLEIAAELHAESKVYVDDINSDAAGGFATAAARMGLTQQGDRWTFREFARLDNLANRRYAGSVIVDESNSRFFEPAPGRTVYGGVSASLSW
jgi:iron complex outermembrane receptor protein